MTPEEEENQAINLWIADACENICTDLSVKPHDVTYDEQRIKFDHASMLPNTFTIDLRGRTIQITVQEV